MTNDSHGWESHILLCVSVFLYYILEGSLERDLACAVLYSCFTNWLLRCSSNIGVDVRGNDRTWKTIFWCPPGQSTHRPTGRQCSCRKKSLPALGSQVNKRWYGSSNKWPEMSTTFWFSYEWHCSLREPILIARGIRRIPKSSKSDPEYYQKKGERWFDHVMK